MTIPPHRTPVLHVTKLVLGTGSVYYLPVFRRLAQTRGLRLHGLDVIDSENLVFLTDGDNATLQSLAFTARDSMFDVTRPIELNQLNKVLPALRSLRSFSLYITLPTEGASKMFVLLSSSLSALSISIQHIKLQIHLISSSQRYQSSELDPPWHLDSPTWTRFRVALDRLTNLETVTFVTEGSGCLINAEAELQKITMELPALERRGLLRYENIKWK